MNKTCIKCGQTKDVKLFATSRNRKKELVYLNSCKECMKIYKQQHYQNNKQTYLDKAKKQRESNPEEYKAYLNKYYQDNKQHILEQNKIYQKTDKGKKVRKLCVTKQRESNPEEYKAYLNKYYQDNKQHILEQNKIYQKTDKGKKVRKLCVTNYLSKANNRIKYNAHKKVLRALKSGKLAKPSMCTICGGNLPLEGHHVDYNKPLEVIWVCKQCHENIHHLNEGHISLE